MSAPAKCPGCGTQLQPDWESCPNCPMHFADAPPEKTAFQSDAFRTVGLPLILFGGLAYFIWSFGQYLWRTAEEGTKTAPAAVIKTAGAAPRSETRKPAEEDEGSGTVSIVADKGVFAPRHESVRAWEMRGVIYDLITLKPVPGVHMIFTDSRTNSRAQMKTDSRGRYRAVLPALAGRGYLVTLSKPGYAKTYLDPGTEGVSEMTLERRRELVSELSSLKGEPASLQPNSDTPLVTDFHMTPE